MFSGGLVATDSGALCRIFSGNVSSDSLGNDSVARLVLGFFIIRVVLPTRGSLAVKGVAHDGRGLLPTADSEVENSLGIVWL